MLDFSLLVWSCSRRLFCPLSNYTSKSLNLVPRVLFRLATNFLIGSNIPGQVTADNRIDRFFLQLRVHETILSIKRTHFNLDYLKQHSNVTKHINEETVQPPSSKELIPIHKVNPFQAVLLLLDPSPSPLAHLHRQEAQSGFTQCVYNRVCVKLQQSVAEQCSPVWDLKSRLCPFLHRPGSHWDKVMS